MPYWIQNVNSKKNLDVTDESMDDGVQIQQYHDHNVTAQQWEIIKLAYNPEDYSRIAALIMAQGLTINEDSPLQGPYLIVSMRSSRALDAWLNSAADNDPIKQYRVHGGKNQQWYIYTENPNHVVGDIRNVLINASNLHALDVLCASSDDHAPIVHFPFHNGLSQQWWFQEPGTRQIASVL